jgi:hypothetical protein
MTWWSYAARRRPRITTILARRSAPASVSALASADMAGEWDAADRRSERPDDAATIDGQVLTFASSSSAKVRTHVVAQHRCAACGRAAIRVWFEGF